MLEVRLLKKVLRSIDQDSMPSIEVLSGTGEGKKIYITDDTSEIVIGRDPHCELPLEDAVISRRHAKIIRRWGGIAIRDLDSKNGTFVNNRQVVEEYLHDGDRIALGTVVMMFRNPQEIDIEKWEELKPKPKTPEVKAEDVPLAEKAAESEEFEGDRGEENELKEPAEEVEELKESLEDASFSAKKQPSIPYPKPVAPRRSRLSAMEIGLMGIGTLVIIFSLIMIANLMFD